MSLYVTVVTYIHKLLGELKTFILLGTYVMKNVSLFGNMFYPVPLYRLIDESLG
jgi:hypothetical protein